MFPGCSCLHDIYVASHFDPVRKPLTCTPKFAFIKPSLSDNSDLKLSSEVYKKKTSTLKNAQYWIIMEEDNLIVQDRLLTPRKVNKQ